MIMRVLFLAGMLVVLLQPFVKAQNDPRAEKLLKEMERKLESYDLFKAEFVYELENPSAGIEESQPGVIIVDRKGRFKLMLDQQTIYCDLDKLVVYMPELDEIQISDYREDDFEFSPSEMFKLYEKGFLYALGGTPTIDGKTFQEVQLTPTDKDKPYFKIKLLIDEKEMEPYQTELRYKNGNVYTYTIDAFYPNPPRVSDRFFEFDASQYPNATVVDLR